MPSYTSQPITAQPPSSGVSIQHELPSLRDSRVTLLLSTTHHSRGGLQSGSEADGSSQDGFVAGRRDSNKDKSYEPTASREIEWEAANTPYPSLEIS